MKKKTQLNVYDVCRHFIVDNAECFSQQETSLLTGLVRSRNFKRLAAITSEFDLHCSEIEKWKSLRQIEAFFKKNADFAVDDECTASAMSSFNRGERICRITNRRLDYYFVKRDRLDPDLNTWITRMESYIRRVLGDFPTFLDAIPKHLRLTSGATASTARRHSLPFQKLGRTIECTPGCEPYLTAAYRYFGYSRPRISHTLENRVELVPKSWKTHRTIACEPVGNVPFQLAFDSYVKRRLRFRGIDLSDQTKNQEHALQGSIDGSIATVDLSMASDTLAISTVAWLLPHDWYNYLRDIRSPCYRFNGSMHKYAKFSSMGNGATFALETLIFAACLHGVGSEIGLAYGDDLTIETELVPDLFRLMKFLGFVPNEEKSFFAGPFRESCGKDFFNGRDITPFYIRSTAVWNTPYACHNVNGLAKISEHGALWNYLRDFVSQNNLPFAPVGYNTLAGVHLHPHHAYRRGLIKNNKRGIVVAKQFLPKGKVVSCYDSRALFLWHLKANSLVRDQRFWHPSFGDQGAPSDDGIRSSRYTTACHGYVRRWVAWVFPGPGGSDHLYGFSEELTRVDAS